MARFARLTEQESSHPCVDDHLGTPEDVAWAAVYLASEESRYVMGSGLVVDGGTISGKPF